MVVKTVTWAEWASKQFSLHLYRTLTANSLAPPLLFGFLVLVPASKILVVVACTMPSVLILPRAEAVSGAWACSLALAWSGDAACLYSTAIALLPHLKFEVGSQG